MSNTENIPDLVEEKKSKLQGMAKEMEKFKEFFTNLTNNVIFKLVVRTIVFGTMGLYIAKVAQSNILPDDVDLSPFTDIKRNVSQTPIDVNIIKERTFWGLGIWDKPINVYSEKIEFDNDEFLKSYNSSLLCLLKKYANPESIFGNVCLYFSKVLSETTANSFWFTNKLFNVYNYLPEWLIMLTSGFYPSIFLGLFFVFNLLAGIIPHIKHLIQYFRKPSWSGSEWESEGNIHFLRPIKWILFWFLWFWISLNSMIIMPIYLTFYNFIAPLTAKYKVQGEPKERHFGNFLLDTIFYKKSFLLSIFSYYLGVNAFKFLPKMYFAALIISLFFIVMYNVLFNRSVDIENTKLTPGLANPKNVQGKVSMGANGFDVCKKTMEYQQGGKKTNIK
jgi:hypothetical protein